MTKLLIIIFIFIIFYMTPRFYKIYLNRKQKKIEMKEKMPKIKATEPVEIPLVGNKRSQGNIVDLRNQC